MFLRKTDRLRQARLPEVMAGAEVYSADDALIGMVVEVGDVSFKVDVPRAPDVWLGRDYVIDANPGRVVMSFNRSELNAYKLGQAGVDPEKDTTQEPLTDFAIPEDQQADQRVRMAEELAEQRQRLPHTHPGGDETVPPETRGGTIGEPVESELRDYGVDPMEDATQELPTTKGEAIEEYSPTGSYVESEQPSGTASAERPRPEPRQSYEQRGAHADIEYSVPTREAEYDPGSGRKAITGGAVAAVSLAGLGMLWMMWRRFKGGRNDRKTV